MIEIGLLTDHIMNDLFEERYIEAIIKASTNLEHLLFLKLFLEGNIPWKEMEKWGLGKLIKKSLELELVDKKYKTLLEDFNELRIIIVHLRTSIAKIKKDGTKKNFIMGLVRDICEFIKATSIKYHDPDYKIEKEKGKMYKSLDKRFERLFKKKYEF